MVDTIFPPSPNWYLSKIISTREDGSVAYGSQSSIVILKHNDNTIHPHIINDAHNDKITSVTFSPKSSEGEIQNVVLSSSDDGFVKLWKIDTLTSLIGHNSHSDSKDSVKVVCAAWSQCNPQFIVSAGENDTVVVWDVAANTTSRFKFPKLKASVIECSYHNEKIVAVGSKSGLVYIIKLAKKGEIIHKLRGHDKEVQALSWCPTYFNKFEGHSVFEQFLLASSSQESEIFIWRTVEGACETVIQLPKSALAKGEENSYRGKWEVGVNFVPLFWASPYLIYSGSKYGELISYDLKRFLLIQSDNKNISEKEFNKKTLNCWKLVHSQHSNILLGVSGVPAKNEINGRTSSNRAHPQVRTADNESAGSLDGAGNETENSNCGVGKKEGSEAGARELGLLWTVGKDQKLIAVREDSSGNDPVFNLHSINGHAFEAAVSPHDPNKIAIAVGDGKIRLWNANKSSGHVRVFWQKINDRVYSVAWHPAKEGQLAYGTSEGRVGLIDVYVQKQALNFRARHHHTVYRLSWGPPFSEDGSKKYDKKDFALYSTGGSSLLLHDPSNVNAEPLNLGKVINTPTKRFTDICWKPDYSIFAVGSANGNVYLLSPPRLEVAFVLLANNKIIQSLTWHPTTTTVDADCLGLTGYFTFGSTSNESAIKVYNCYTVDNITNVEQVADLKGHSAYVQSVSWSTHVAGRLISTGADFSVRIWDVTTHTQLIKFNASQSKLPLFCIWSPIDPDILIAGFADRMMLSWKISKTCPSTPIVKDHKVKGQNNINLSALIDCSEKPRVEGEENRTAEDHSTAGALHGLALAKAEESHKTTKEMKMFAKAWKSHKDPFQNCYELLKRGTNEEEDLNFILPFLGDDNHFLDFLNSEAESQQKANNWTECYQLALWRGTLKGVIEEKIKTGHVDDFLISLAPFVSPRLWQEACISYSKTLVEKKLYRKAACYLMAVHRIEDAIDVLANANLYLEAICVARCRLPESDPVSKKLVRRYANWLTETGSYLKACECLIYLEEYLEAAKLLAKKNGPEYLRLAAAACRKAGSEDLESEYSYSALLLCLEALNWDLASQICSDHNHFKRLTILCSVHRLLCQLDAGEMALEEDLMTRVNELTGTKGDPTTYSTLRYIYDKHFVYTDKKKLFVTVAQELSLACCAVEHEVQLTHVIRALNAASRYMKKGKDDVHPLHKLCLWLSPKGYLAESSIFRCTDEDVRSKIISLRAFLCQGIVEHLDNILSQESGSGDFGVDLNESGSVLRELVGDVLDKEAFAYFKNQVELKSCEKRINEAYQRKCKEVSDKVEGEISRKAVNGADHGLERSDSVSGATEDDRAGSAEVSDGGATHEDAVIASERERMNQLKRDVKDFENSRVIAPNPAFVYCLLRRVSQAFQSPENGLTDYVEEKWRELEAV